MKLLDALMRELRVKGSVDCDVFRGAKDISAQDDNVFGRSGGNCYMPVEARWGWAGVRFSDPESWRTVLIKVAVGRVWVRSRR